MKCQDEREFSVAGKIFGVLCLRETTAGTVNWKVEGHRLPGPTERPWFIPPPYLARAHWGQAVVHLPVPVTELPVLLRRSYERVRARPPKKTQRDLAD